MGIEANLRISEEKSISSLFSGFVRYSSHPLEKGEKGRKRAKKADFGPFAGRAGQAPLNPPFFTPPFAAAQFF